VRAEWRLNADDDRIASGEMTELSGRAGAITTESTLDAIHIDVADVRLAAVQGLSLVRVDVKTHDRETCFFEEQHERQSHLPKTNDANPRSTRLDQELVEC
jgi:hypothetical protein